MASYLATAGVLNNLTVAQTAGVLTVSDTEETIRLSPAAASLGFQGNGSHTITGPVAALTALNLDTVDQTDQVTLNARGLLLPINLSNAAGRTDLTVDDRGDSTFPLGAFLQTGELDLNERSTITFDNANLESLTLNGGGGGNTLYVFGTPPGATTTLNTGTGAGNEVNVYFTSSPLLIHGEGARDRVTLGGSVYGVGLPLSYLQSSVTVQNSGGFTDLVADDSADPLGQTATLTPGAITGLAGADLFYNPGEVGSLRIVGGSGGNTFTVADTAPGFTTTLTSTGSDNVDVLHSTGKLQVLDSTGTDTVQAAADAGHWQHIVTESNLTPGATVDGTLDTGATVHEYPLDLTNQATGGFLTLRVTPSPGSILDSRLDLLNTPSYVVAGGSGLAGGLLASSAGHSLTDSEAVATEFVLPGQYFVRVSSASGTATGAYTLTSTFQPADPPYDVPAPDLRVGTNPVEIIAADVNHDGAVDLITANHDSGDVSVLLGNGDGSFQPERRFALAPGDHPDRIAAVDFNQDGRLDLVALDRTTQSVDALLGVGDGTFLDQQVLHLAATDPVVTDRPDLLRLFSGQAQTIALQDSTGQALDFNRDGSPDQAYLHPTDPGAIHASNVTLWLGLALGNQALIDYPPVNNLTLGGPIPGFYLAAYWNTYGFTPLGQFADPSRDTPLLGDLNGDGVPDLVTVSRSGQILVRLGRPGQPGVFDPPTVVNGAGNPGAREVALVATGVHAQLAALSLGQPGSLGNQVAVYSPEPDPGTRHLTWTRTFLGSTGLFPVRLAAGDLDGDGHNDLVIANGQLPTLTVYLNQGNGSFARVPDLPLPAGLPSDLLLTDPHQDGHADIVVADVNSGDVGVLRNQHLPPGRVGFDDPFRLRAGLADQGTRVHEGIFSFAANQAFTEKVLPVEPPPHNTVDAFDQWPTEFGQPPLPLFPGNYTGAKFLPPLFLQSALLQTSAVAGRDFNGDGVPDLVALNRGANSFSILLGKQGPDGQANGAFLDPQTEETFATGAGPSAISVGDFNGDGVPDLAILNGAEHSIWIDTGDGHGGFTHTFTVDAGNAPTGLSVAHVDHDGHLDLLVGNVYGDVLQLRGRGDGTFRPPATTAATIALAAAPLGQEGQDQFVFSNQGHDHVAVQASGRPSRVFQERRNGLLAPGKVQLADLNGDGLPDLVVANSGENDVLVYLGVSPGQFDPTPHTFPVGADPVGVSIADVNGDHLPDLVVADQGANAVSILLGQGSGSSWTLTAGPRLDSGGQGPVAVAVQDVTGDGVPDLVVTNGQSNNVAILSGLGNGFFNDQTPRLLATGSGPRETLIGHFEGGSGLDLVTVNARSNDVTFIANLDNPAATHTVTLATGGLDPVAAVAGDFNHDGLQDLVIANHDDGVVSLLLGQESGSPTLESFRFPDLTEPTDLAEVSDAEGVRLYGVNEGEESAILLVFGVGLPSDLATPGTAALAATPAVVVAQPLSLQTAGEDFSLPIVATLLATVGDIGPETPLLITPQSPDFAFVSPETLLARGEDVAALDSGQEVPDDQGGNTEAGESTGETPSDRQLSVSGFVLGLDEALRRTVEEARAHLLPEDGGTLSSESVTAVLQALPLWTRGLDLSAAELPQVVRGLSQALNEISRFAVDPLGNPAARFAPQLSVPRMTLPEPLPPAPQGAVPPNKEGLLPDSATPTHELLRADLVVLLFVAGFASECWPATVSAAILPARKKLL